MYAPQPKVQKQIEADKDSHLRKKTGTDESAEWRARIEMPEAKEMHKRRAGTTEWPNAGARSRCLCQVDMRGPEKLRVVVM